MILMQTCTLGYDQRMRENPWHIRRATHLHSRWYRNLLEQHALTLAWLAELKLDRPAHFIGLSLGADARDSLDLLERIASQAWSQESLESLLDDTAPEDTLGRLEHTIHLVQAIALKKIFERVPDHQRTMLKSQLEQVSWRKGREGGALRWPLLSKNPPGNLPAVFQAFTDNPWKGAGLIELYLPWRIVDRSAEFELLMCPHQNRNSAVQWVADDLCWLQRHYDRGFVYALQPQVLVEYLQAPESRCRIRWQLPH